MVEEPDAGDGQDHPVFVGGGGDVVVPQGPSGMDHVFYPATGGPVDVVPKGDEGV